MRKQIMIGVDSFEEIIKENYYYIDKSLLIKDLLENRGKVTLITRPRRFGKTLNMSMMKSFFDARNDNRHLFEGLEIMDHEDIIEKHLGKYPVVFMTLKDVEFRTYDVSIDYIKDLVSGLYKQHLYILEQDLLDDSDKETYMSYRRGKITENKLSSAIMFLTECLYTYYGKKTVVLIDEYDTPINNALQEGYYQEMIEFMRGFLGSVFKSNENLEFGVLTGVQRVSKESLASGFNNPKVFGITQKAFSGCYGFTEDEVITACEEYGYGDRFCEVKKWYDGYRFGSRDMYNPWSIMNYLSEGELRNYWANTGGLSVLEDIFAKGNLSLKDDTVTSNRESGKGRSDCTIKPDDKSKNAVVVEFKHIKNSLTDDATEHLVSTDSESGVLVAEARKGLEQIEEKAYVHSLTQEGYEKILRYGIAFHKKTCEVAMMQ